MATVAGSLRNKVLVLDDLTTGDLTVTGALTLSGTATQINSTNTTISDHLIELGSGLTAANTNDLGLILERGSTGNNVFIGWDESADKVVVATTTATGSSTGNLSLSYANFQAAGGTFTGNVSMATGASSGKFAVMSSAVHGSYDFYNNGTTYLNGSVIIDDALDITGTNRALKIAGVTRINSVGDFTGTSYYRGSDNIVNTDGDIFAADTDSTTNPSFAFIGHTDSGLSISVSASNDQLSVITDGVRRGYFNNAGITSASNVYTSGAGAFRNYAASWIASTGLTGNGFSFINSVDGTPMTISSTGTVTALADMRAPIFYDSSNTDFYIDPVGNSKLYGTLYLGHTNTQPGNLTIYDTGNNALEIKGTGANAFQFDMIGTGSTGTLTLNDFDLFTNKGFTGASGDLLRRNVTGWTVPIQTSIGDFYGTNLGDYVYLKAAGNSTAQHGILLVGDNSLYYGRTSIETGIVTNDAEAPLDESVAFKITQDGDARFKTRLGIGVFPATNGNSNSQDTTESNRSAPLHIRTTANSGAGTQVAQIIENFANDYGTTPLKLALDFKGQDTNNAENYVRLAQVSVNDTDYGINHEATSHFIMGMTDAGTYNETHMFHARGHFLMGNSNAFNPTAHINSNSGYFSPDTNGKFLNIAGGSHGAFINLMSDTTTDNDQIGGIYWTRTAGAADAHKQLGGIDVIQDDYTGTNTLDGGHMRFFTKQSGSAPSLPRMKIQDTGQIGIGTGNANVSYQLQVNSGSTNTTSAFISSDDKASILIQDNDTNTYISAQNSTSSIGSQNGIHLDNVNIDNTGKVGIKNTDPLYALDIHEANTNQAAIQIKESAANSSWLRMVPNLGSGGFNSMSSAGDIGLIFSIDNDSSTDASNGLTIAPWSSTSGNQGLKIWENGHVGIGASQPAARLHISGNSDISDEDCMLIIEDIDGSAGSRLPAIMFRSNTGGTVTNQGRIRGTDTQGMVLSGSSALSNDLVVKASGVDIGGTLNLANAGFVSFYGNGSRDHSIGSYLDDDIRINSYGSIFLSLDSNGNNDSAADFKIVKHAGGTSSWANNQELLCLRGDNSNGDLTIGGSFGLSDQPYYAKLAIPGTEAAWGVSGTSTGAVVIDLPGTLNNYDMLYLEIDVFEYNGKGGSKIIIGTHNWNSGGNSNTSSTMWHNTDVRIVGRFDKEIYFGWRNDGTNNRRVIVLGNHTSSWSYATVHVGKVSGATDFYTAAIDYTGNWNVTQTTSSSFYTKSPTTDFNGSDRRTLRIHRSMHANRVYADSDMRAPHYYDLDNTGFYTNPASTSHMNAIYLADGIYHKDDSDTCIKFTTNEIDMDVGGVKALHSDSSRLNINPNGSSFDFRVSGDNEANLIYADGSTDRVGIGTATPSQDLDIYGASAGLRVLKTANDAKIIAASTTAAGWVEFQSPNYYSGLLHLINGTEQWALGTLQGQSHYTLRRGRSGNTVISATTDETVGIGIQVPSDGDVSGRGTPKLHVLKSTTQGVNNLVARFESGNDNDNTGAAILINHSNDRGLLIEGGRGASDRGIAHFGIVNSGGTNTRLMTLHQDGSDYKVGIGTEAPASKLHISNNAAPANDVTLLTLQNGNSTGDISTPDTFIDFEFRDSNVNTTPQARIGAHAGDGGDANSTTLEGKGYLTFHTSDTTGTSAAAPPERIRIAADGQLLINKTGSDVGASTNIVEADGNFRIQGGNRSIKFNNGSHEIVGIAQIASNKMQYGSQRLTIDVGNSRVGIGATSPQRKLVVTESSAGTAGDNSGILSLTVGTGANTDSKMAFGVDSSHRGWIHVVKPGNNVMPLLLNPTASSNGKVGIGCVPAAMLDVEAGGLGGTTGNTTTAAIFRAGRQNFRFQDTRTATGTDWNNATFKMIAQIDATDHQSIDFVNDAGFLEHIDIRTGNQVFNTRFASNGRVGIGTNNPGCTLHSTGEVRGTSFTDHNNTGYYVDPAASSKMVYLGLATDPDTSGSYRLQMGGNIDMNNNHIHYTQQLHFNTGIRFVGSSNSVLNLYGDNTSAVQLNLGTGAAERNGAVYANSSNQIGFLDSDNHWAIRHVANSATYFSINNVDKVRVNNLGIRFEGAQDNGQNNSLQRMSNLAGANLLAASTDIARRYGNGSQREFRTFVDGTSVPCHYSQGVNNSATCYQWISTEFVDIDPEKSYQYTLWVQAEGDHNIYMGWHEKNASGSQISSNPYFHTATMDTNTGWVKITGILHGHRAPTPNSDTEGSDRYASNDQFLDGGSGVGSGDGVMHSTTTQIMMRFGSCYGTSNTAKTYFYAPTIKEINYENHQHGYTVPNIQNNVVQAGSMHIGKTSWSNYSGIEYRDCSGSQEFRMSSTSGDLNLRVDGTVQAHGSGGIEASIFKDLNNASYYVHPDGVSVLNHLQLNGSLRFDNSAGAMDKSGTTLKIGDIDENDDYEAVDILALAGTGRLYLADSVLYVHGTSNSSAKFRMNSSGQLDCDGDVIAFSSNISSDRKLKENIRPIENSLDKVLTLEGVKFDWKDDKRDNDQLGFIAQDVEKVLPELVSDVDTLGAEEGEKHKVVNYDGVIPILVEAIKELKAEINDLKDKLNNK